MKPVLAPAELAGSICELASDRKGADIVELDVRGVIGYADYFVICTGNTDRQTRAIHDAVREGLAGRHGLRPRSVEGFTQGSWIVMDYLDVVLHIFTPDTRAYYRLEELWGEAPARAVAG